MMKTTRHIKSLPETDRPYEKCLEQGPGALTDRELLAVILRTGTRGRNSLDVAGDVLALSKDTSFEGIVGLLHLSVEELMRVSGIGKVKAIELKCVGELSQRIGSAKVKNQIKFQNSETVASYYMEKLRHLDKEVLMGLMLDTKLGLLAEVKFSTGTMNKTYVSTREVFQEAMRLHASNLILVHNHPSGDPTPSTADAEMTKVLAKDAKIIDLVLLDHIIIGDKSFYSFKENGWKGKCLL